MYLQMKDRYLLVSDRRNLQRPPIYALFQSIAYRGLWKRARAIMRAFKEARASFSTDGFPLGKTKCELSFERSIESRGTVLPIE